MEPQQKRQHQQLFWRISGCNVNKLDHYERGRGTTYYFYCRYLCLSRFKLKQNTDLLYKIYSDSITVLYHLSTTYPRICIQHMEPQQKRQHQQGWDSTTSSCQVFFPLEITSAQAVSQTCYSNSSGRHCKADEHMPRQWRFLVPHTRTTVYRTVKSGDYIRAENEFGIQSSITNFKYIGVETRVSEENHSPVASHWQTLSHNVVLSTPGCSLINFIT
jgi:hypothetical protein